MIHAFISGRVGRDAELRTTQSGQTVCSFSVAVDNGKDANGVKREPTWVKCSIWGTRAPKMAPTITKGLIVMIQGRPRATSYQDKGQLEISVGDFDYGGGGQGNVTVQSLDVNQLTDQQKQDALAARDYDDPIPF